MANRHSEPTPHSPDQSAGFSTGLADAPHQGTAAGIDALFHCLADPTRRAVVERLSRGPATVGELARPVRMALPSFLQHLRVLERGGVIRTEKEGRVRVCRLDTAALDRLGDWIARQRAVWEGRLDRLDAYLQTMKGENDDRS